MLDIAGGIIIAVTVLGMMRWGVNILASDQYGGRTRVWGYVFCLLALGFMYWLVIGRFLSAEDYQNLLNSILHGRKSSASSRGPLYLGDASTGLRRD